MAGKERRRIQVSTSLKTVNQQENLQIVIEEGSVNAHAIRASIMCEPQDADANANGMWGLFALLRSTEGVPSLDVPTIDLEADNPTYIALGTWGASNQSPFNHNIEIGTSRNLPKNARLVLGVQMDGISAGSVRVLQMLTCFIREI